MSQARLRKKIIRAKLPDVILKNDVHPSDIGDPKSVVAEAETRVDAKRTKSFSSNRSRAAELHREAEQLYFKGDYESALVLYHRAARLFPREIAHAVAARRAEVAISSAADPTKINPKLVRMMRDAKNPGQLGAIICPETAVRRAKGIMMETENLDKDVPRILRYLDKRKDFWRLSSFQTKTPREIKSRPMQRQLNRCVKSTVKDVENACSVGDSEAVRKLSLELVSLVSLTEEPRRNQVDAYAYLVAKQMELNRHDRAIDLASRMLFLARTNADIVGIVEALTTIGEVHLKFGHLDALVKVWERLVADIEMEPTAQAWLYHDIGRCHLELGSDHRAVQSATSCLEQAKLAKSTKWTLRGQLLCGQSLLKLGRLPEAVTAFKVAGKIAAEEGDDERSILLYVQNLIDQVTCLLRQLNSEIESRKPVNEFSGELHQTDVKNSTSLVSTSKESPHPTSPESSTLITTTNQTVSDVPTKPSVSIIKRLLDKTRALRPNDKSLEELPTDSIPSSDCTYDENENYEEHSTMVTSRTRILRRNRDGGEQMYSNDEKISSEIFSIELENVNGTSFRDGQNDGIEGASGKIDSPSDVHANNEYINDESHSYFSDYDELTSRSFSYNLENETEPVEMSMSIEQQTGLSDYLKTLDPQDFAEFLLQERRFFDDRTNVDRFYS